MNGASTSEERRIEEAIAWHQALAADDADWDGFTAWLEANPENRAAYDEIAMLDRIVDERAPSLAALRVRDDAAPQLHPRRRRWAVAVPIAAALVATLGYTTLTGGGAVAYATAAGEHRTLALADGVQVELAPATRLVTHPRDPARLELASGEAYFAVTHDPARTLTVTAGSLAVSDIGTRFAVSVGPAGARVGVADGRIAVTVASGAATPVAAGQELVALDGEDAQLTQVSAADVGSWRGGRLSYAEVPLAIVAADLQRYTGRPVMVDPALNGRRFSGVLVVGDGSKLVANLTEIMGIGYRAERGGTRLVAAPRR